MCFELSHLCFELVHLTLVVYFCVVKLKFQIAYLLLISQMRLL